MFLSIERIDVEMPFGAAISKGDEGVLKEIEEEGKLKRVHLNIALQPGEGGGKLRLSFIPTKIGPPRPERDHPVKYLERIGDTLAEKLKKAGIKYVGDLAEAGPRRTAEATGISRKKVESFVAMARLVKLGARNQTAEILSNRGLTPEKLAEMETEEVLDKAEDAIEKGSVRLPKDYKLNYGELDAIVHQAKALKKDRKGLRY
jgi:hypothetical protein